MDNKLITVSASPHIQTDDSVNKIMYRVILALVPAFLVSIYVFLKQLVFLMETFLMFLKICSK